MRHFPPAGSLLCPIAALPAAAQTLAADCAATLAGTPTTLAVAGVAGGDLET
jgi:hypothetical protein